MQTLNIIKLNILSKPENVAVARVAVAAFVAQIDLTVEELEDIKVAVSEAISNSIIHGYENKDDQWVEIIARRFSQAFEITISDQGKGIEDIKKAMEPAFSSDPSRMGLGFVFMQSFMDEVDVVSEPGMGTAVKLVKKLAVVQGTPN
ncbi:MAG: anti-sigma F factor [Bacillota bacterium]